MKRTALALHTLIRSRFRGDDLQLIGFGRHAEVMEIEQLTALDAHVGQGHQPPPRAAAGQPALPQAPERPAGAADRHRRRADLPPRAGRRGLLLLPAAPADRRLRRRASSTTPAASARRRRSSGSARTRAWPASSTRWPSGSTAAWSRPSSTTSAPPWSAPTSAPRGPRARCRRRLRRLVRRPRLLGRRLSRVRLGVRPSACGRTTRSGRVQDRRQLLDAVDEAGPGSGPGGVGVDRVHGYAGRQDAGGDQLVGQPPSRRRGRSRRARTTTTSGRGGVHRLPGDPHGLRARPSRAAARRRRPRPSPAPSGPARTAGRSTPAASPAAAAGRRPGGARRPAAPRSDGDQRRRPRPRPGRPAERQRSRRAPRRACAGRW